MKLRTSQIRNLPKVELHRHLDGSVRYETIKDLAKIHNLDLGHVNEQELIAKTKIKTPMKSLQQVLDCFWTTQKVQCCYEAIKRVAFENVEDAFRDGVKLVELRFAPTFLAENKDIQNDEIIEGVLDGITEGMAKYPIQVGLIHILPRSFDYDKNVQSTNDIIRYAKGNHKNADRICGFDLADIEENYDIAAYAKLMDQAREAGLGITVHSGENTGAENVRTSIETFKAQRIGHGIHIWGDNEVMELVRQKDIHLEICPISNWLTNSVPTLEEHPIKHLFAANISLSINSDDPQLMDIDLVKEYQSANQHYGFGIDDFKKMNQMALKHSFLNQDIKEAIKAQLA